MEFTPESYAEAKAAPPHPKERVFFEAFVDQYIKDFDGHKAMSRLGYAKVASSGYTKFIDNPYVQALIFDKLRGAKAEDLVSRNEVMLALWREGHKETNSGSERIAALTQVSKMLGADLSAPTPVVNVMVVPGLDMNAWLAEASSTQQQLKASVVDEA